MHSSAISGKSIPSAAPTAWRGAAQELADRRLAALAGMLGRPGLLGDLAALEVRDTGRGRARDRATRLAAAVDAVGSRLAAARVLGELGPDAPTELLFARPLGTIELELGVADGLAFALAALLVAAKTGNLLRLAPEAPLMPALELLARCLDADPAGPNLTLTPPIGTAREDSGHILLVDPSANADAAAARLMAVKADDNGTARGAAAAVLAVADAAPSFLRALIARGAYRLGREASARAAATLCRAGVPNRTLVGRDARVLAIGLGLPPSAASARLLVAEPEDPPLSGPLLRLPGSLVLALWPVADWAAAVAALHALAARVGGIESLGVETRQPDRARRLAAAVDVGRIAIGTVEDPLLAELEPGGRLDWRRFVRLTRLRLAVGRPGPGSGPIDADPPAR
jgi:acyl-CoA reductase-like NAD-dependent aldehyde dehydrogenase